MRAAEPANDRRFLGPQELHPSRMVHGDDEAAVFHLQRARMRGQLDADHVRPTLEQSDGSRRFAGLGKPPPQRLSQPFHEVAPILCLPRRERPVPDGDPQGRADFVAIERLVRKEREESLIGGRQRCQEALPLAGIELEQNVVEQ